MQNVWTHKSTRKWQDATGKPKISQWADCVNISPIVRTAGLLKVFLDWETMKSNKGTTNFAVKVENNTPLNGFFSSPLDCYFQCKAFKLHLGHCLYNSLQMLPLHPKPSPCASSVRLQCPYPEDWSRCLAESESFAGARSPLNVVGCRWGTKWRLGEDPKGKH